MAVWECELIVRRSGARDAVAVLGHAAVRTVAAGIDDELDNLELLSALAFHPSVSVRAEVARRDHIDEAAVDHLLTDREPAVRQAILWSAAARRRITLDWATAAIEGDATIAEDVIREIDAFSEIDPAALLGDLARHADPAVRIAMAGAREGGRALLRELCRDDDPEVRQAAHATLRDW